MNDSAELSRLDPGARTFCWVDASAAPGIEPSVGGSTGGTASDDGAPGPVTVDDDAGGLPTGVLPELSAGDAGVGAGAPATGAGRVSGGRGRSGGCCWSHR